MHDLSAGLTDRPNRHHQGIDDDVGARDAVILRALHDLLRDLEADVGVLGDPGLVVGDRHHRRAVLLHQGEDRFEPLLLAGDRVHQRLAFVHFESGFERGDDGRIDRQGDVGDRLHELHRPREQGGLVRQRNAGVDVEHVRAGLHLGPGIGLDAGEVVRRHLRREHLAAGGVDALADDDERPFEPDGDLAVRRADHGLRQGPLPASGDRSRGRLAIPLRGIAGATTNAVDGRGPLPKSGDR